MNSFLKISADYSNAVLVVLLPIFSDFVKKMDLPMLTPITTQQVEHFVPYPDPENTGGYLVVTNGLELWYSHGHVEGFRTPRSYYNVQGDFATEVPRFYGPLRLTKAEALALARDSLRKIGYGLKETFTDQDPDTDMPPRVGTNIVPNYRFTWQDPVFGGRAVQIEVDANRKMVQEMKLRSKFFWRSPPRVWVAAEPLNRGEIVSATASNAYLAKILPKISDFTRKLNLPVRVPVESQDLDRVQFVDSDWVVRVRLKGGYWFDCEKEHVAGFTAPDCAFVGKSQDRPRPLREYLGNWRLSAHEATELVRAAIRALGKTPEEFDAELEPNLTKRKQVGEYVVPRYFLSWLKNDERTGAGLSYVTAEVDANKRVLKHLYLLKNDLPGPAGPVIPIIPTNALPSVNHSFGDPNKRGTRPNSHGGVPGPVPLSSPFE